MCLVNGYLLIDPHGITLNILSSLSILSNAIGKDGSGEPKIGVYGAGFTGMSAEGNAMLVAKDNIVLGVAHSLEGQSQENKAKASSFDNRGSLIVGALNNKGNGKGNTDSITGTTLLVGGTATLATTTGDITLTGSSVVGGGDTAISAAKNLTIESGQNGFANDNHSNNKAIGKVGNLGHQAFCRLQPDQAQRRQRRADSGRVERG